MYNKQHLGKDVQTSPQQHQSSERTRSEE